VVRQLWEDNYRVYGARKIWKAARRCGHDVGRDFTATAPNQLWVTDLTFVPTWAGIAYVCFIIDACSRAIVGWRVASHMRTMMVLDAIEIARWSRGTQFDELRFDRLRCHSDAGSQFTSVRYGERLAEIAAVPSIGTIGDSYDNALAETVNGYYKAELIRGPAREGRAWKTVEDVELATSAGSTGTTTNAYTATSTTSRQHQRRLEIRERRRRLPRRPLLPQHRTQTRAERHGRTPRPLHRPHMDPHNQREHVTVTSPADLNSYPSRSKPPRSVRPSGHDPPPVADRTRHVPVSRTCCGDSPPRSRSIAEVSRIGVPRDS